MPTADDRDRTMDRLLRASTPDMLAGEPGGCIDAEQLAAWADGGLDASAARIVETHLASCASCQAMAAVFARSMPAAVAPSRSAWTGRWMVPIAATAAAAALAIWVLVPRPPAAPAAERTMAENEIAPVAPVPVAPEPVAPAAAAPSARAMRNAASSAATPNRDASASSLGAPMGSLRRSADVSERQKTAEMRPEPPPPAAVAPARETTTVTAEAPLIQAQSGERGFTVSTAQVENLPVEHSSFAGLSSLAPSSVAAEFAVPNVMLDSISPMNVGGVTPADARAVASSAPTRWRVLASGIVQRSTTNGASWDAVAIDPAVHVTTGVAPLPAVCWLVGRGGVVLRTSDAQHFERLPFPASVDLVLIRAQDGASATVTAADGRMWTTTDEGKTWR